MKNENGYVRNRIAILVLFILIAGSIAGTRNLYADDTLETIKKLWQENRYQDAAERLYEYRKQPFCRTPTVDYLLATCYCSIPESRQFGHIGLRSILEDYYLDAASQKLVSEALDKCESGHGQNWVELALKSLGNGGSVGGKIYPGSKLRGVASYPSRISRVIANDVFSARLFALNDRSAAIEYTRARLGSNFAIHATDHFLVASRSQHTPEHLTEIGNTLEEFLAFFRSEYEFTTLQQFITIYMVPDSGVLRTFASEHHGLEVSEYCIGYWFKHDLSLVGVIPGRIMGTLAHELFHLMVRSQFGNIPPWLDEGMASLYEVSEKCGTRINGLPNWRGKILSDLWGMQPRVKVKDLFRMNWDEFNNAREDYELEKQAINYAMARYFVLYIQEKNKLKEVYRAFRDQDIFRMDGSPQDKALRLLGPEIGPLDQINEEFEKWFLSLKHEN